MTAKNIFASSKTVQLTEENARIFSGINISVGRLLIPPTSNLSSVDFLPKNLSTQRYLFIVRSDKKIDLKTRNLSFFIGDTFRKEKRGQRRERNRYGTRVRAKKVRRGFLEQIRNGFEQRIFIIRAATVAKWLGHSIC
jgi:hypothetical protein